jgi:hypothetical protein
MRSYLAGRRGPISELLPRLTRNARDSSPLSDRGRNERNPGGENDPSLQLVQQLGDWLLHHIASEDVAFAEFLRTKEARSD